jgi:ribonuclease P protein component
MDQTLGKVYKLCSQKIIGSIYEDKKVVKQFPMLIHYKICELPEAVPFQLVFSAPKRTFRKAHDRNRIKRLMRETVRKNKLILESFLKEKNIQIALFLVYTNKEEMPYDLLLKKTEQLFQKLIVQLQNELQDA